MRMKSTTIRKIASILLVAALLATLLGACTSPMDVLRNLFSKKDKADMPFAGLELSDYVDPGEYKGITALFQPLDADSAAVSAQAKMYFMQNRIPLGVKDDKSKDVVAKGDFVSFDFEGSGAGLSEDTLAGMKGDNYVLEIGSGSFISEYTDKDGKVTPGFEDQMIGKPREEKFDVNVVFPDYYPNDETLQGKPITFKCTIHKIGDGVITDEGVQQLTQGQMNTVDELLAYVKEELTSEVAYQNAQLALETALEGAEFLKDLPKKEADYYILRLEDMAKEAGQTVDEILLTNGYAGDAEQYKEEDNPRQVRQDLFAYAVAEKEGITVEDEDFKNLLDYFRGGDPSVSDDDVYARVGKSWMHRILMSEKVSQFIYENAKDSPAAKSK